MEIEERKISRLNRSKYFRKLLQDEFTKRCRRNSSYSLRAFSKSLNIDPSLLSKLLKGDREFTKAMILRLGVSAGIPSKKIRLLDLFQSPSSSNFSFIEERFFEPISDWYYFAILEVLLVPELGTTEKEIARSIDVGVNECRIALKRLEEQGFVRQSENTCWQLNANENNTWSSQSFTNDSRKQLQKQFLNKAAEAIDQVDLEKRENGSLTLAIDVDLIPEVKERIRLFKLDLANLASKHGNYNSVYQLALAFYPLNQENKKQEKKND